MRFASGRLGVRGRGSPDLPSSGASPTPRMKASNSDALLTISSLSAGYGRQRVLSDADLTMRERSVVGLLGPNGAGKTTLLRSICGQTTIMGGTISLGDQRLDQRRTYRIAELGIAHVVEGRGMLRAMSVRDNLLIGAYRRPGNIEERLDGVLELFPRLGERLDQASQTLSGGEQQMLALGRGLMMAPVLMLLDEPSQGLSPLVVDQVVESILRIREQGVTILVVEQVPSLLQRLCDEVVFVAGGSVSKAVAPDALDADLVRRLLTEGRFPSSADADSRPPAGADPNATHR
jgi:branched-chain amino acid transport system ATP-binding protein